MSFGSDNDFPPLADFYLNQILGFQDVNDIKNRTARLRDAFQRQHGWDDNTVGDTLWNIAWPNWDLGDHVGTIGVAGHTTFVGDGNGLTNLNLSVSSMKNSTLVLNGFINITVTSFWAFTIVISVGDLGNHGFYWIGIRAENVINPTQGAIQLRHSNVGHEVTIGGTVRQILYLDGAGPGIGAGSMNLYYKVYKIDET